MIEFVTVTEIAQLISSYLPEPHASLMNGITFGIELDRGTTFYDQLKIVGLVHIVVLSGMNISLLSAVVINILIPLGKIPALLLSILAIVSFVSFVGLDPPVVRAAVMGSLVLLATALGRKPIPFYLLGISAVVLLLAQPDWISSVSFQLSYAATTGILLFTKPQTLFEEVANPLLRLWNYVKIELRTSLAAQAFTAPIIWYHFEEVSIISPIANVIVSWTIAPIMIIGSIAAVVGSISWHAGFVVSLLAYPLLSVIIITTELLSGIPFAAIMPGS